MYIHRLCLHIYIYMYTYMYPIYQTSLFVIFAIILTNSPDSD